MRLDILVVRHLDAGIYRSQGGGQPREYSRHPATRPGFARALHSHACERHDARTCYGQIGAGIGYLLVVPAGEGVYSPGAVRLPQGLALDLLAPPADDTLAGWLDAVTRATAHATAVTRDQSARYACTGEAD